MKRNEQGTWLKRYCCIVPHMFLYYFDNETAENPVGIIDLQYYTSADIQAGNILKLSTSESVKARSFFFQIDDPSILSEWIGCIHRERYGVIRDERDAYQQLQDHFSSQMEFSMKMMEENSTEKEKMLQETNNLQRTIESSLMCIKSSLEILGVWIFCVVASLYRYIREVIDIFYLRSFFTCVFDYLLSIGISEQ